MHRLTKSPQSIEVWFSKKISITIYVDKDIQFIFRPQIFLEILVWPMHKPDQEGPSIGTILFRAELHS